MNASAVYDAAFGIVLSSGGVFATTAALWYSVAWLLVAAETMAILAVLGFVALHVFDSAWLLGAVVVGFCVGLLSAVGTYAAPILIAASLVGVLGGAAIAPLAGVQTFAAAIVLLCGVALPIVASIAMCSCCRSGEPFCTKPRFGVAAGACIVSGAVLVSIGVDAFANSGALARGALGAAVMTSIGARADGPTSCASALCLGTLAAALLGSIVVGSVTHALLHRLSTARERRKAAKERVRTQTLNDDTSSDEDDDDDEKTPLRRQR